MAKNVSIYLYDIVTSIDTIQQYVKGVQKKDFLKNILLQDAVIRRLEIIGEATYHLPDDFKEQYNYISWHKAVGMRNIIAHEYSEVDMDIIWTTILQDLPLLKEQVETIISK